MQFEGALASQPAALLQGLAAREAKMEKILIVLSGADRIDLPENRTASTGYFLSELAIPASRLINAGFEVIVATPGAKKPAMDERSDKARYFGGDPQKLQAAHNFIENDPSMRRPISLRDAATHADEFAAAFIPGGHAPIIDLMQDRHLGKILRNFHRAGKPVAALCHGPVALLAALPHAVAYRKALVEGDLSAAAAAAGDWPYGGYRMTVFSNDEEELVELDAFGAHLQFHVADALADAGGWIENAPPFEPLVVTDRELVTGQNPASAEKLAAALLTALSGTVSRAVA
jgi:putative intracellular protease/amidase